MFRIILALILLLILVGGGYWFARKAGWLQEPLPYNPPTAEEIRRMEAVERSSATQAENPKAGAGVRPAGSTPPPAAVVSTSTATSTASTTDTTEDAQESPVATTTLESE